MVSGRTPVQINALGPLEALDDGEVANLGGSKQRSVLAVLLTNVNNAVSTDRLVDELWGSAPPRTAHRTVQAYVASLRRELEAGAPGTLEACRPGYRVSLDVDSHDVLLFERLGAQGRASILDHPDEAVSLLRRADSLWRGDAYADVVGSAAISSEVRRLESLRINAIEARVGTELELGRHRELLTELEDLVDRHPLRESERGQLMTALYRSGRQSDALRFYQRTRHVLGEELGIEPSPELRELEMMILQHDPAIKAPQVRHAESVVPRVRYVETRDGAHIAHYTLGAGNVDLLYVPGWVSNLETLWEHPTSAHFLRRLAGVGRLICFDKRGTGLSDRLRPDDLPSIEVRSDDVRAVLDAVGSESAVLFGVSEGGPLCATFAALNPERREGLVIYGSYATRRQHPDYPWAPSDEERERWLSFIEKEWGTEVDLRTLAPSMADDEEFTAFWSRYLRSGASPAAAAALGRMNTDSDARDLVAAIEAPTLVVHRIGDRESPVEGARWLADHIPGSILVELVGSDHLPQVNSDQILDVVEQFIEKTIKAADR
jgi:DNA-binding SARP family transcriptional activator/pimeloyl-ACP methyl ester carboxylesterase